MFKKYTCFCFALVICLLAGCRENPFTGKKTLAFVSDSALFAQSFAEYSSFMAKQRDAVVENTKEAALVEKVGDTLRDAAEKWLAAEGNEDYLDDYEWEYHLVNSDEVNAWCMPGGKIVVYAGILPLAQNEAGLATVMGHELAHALLNHGQQRESGNILKMLGSVAVHLFTSDEDRVTRQAAQMAYDAGSTLLGTLPFSRKHEIEADEVGLNLLAIAGYDPSEAAAFWSRMNALNENSGLEFLSTHPSDVRRVENIRASLHKAKVLAAKVSDNALLE